LSIFGFYDVRRKSTIWKEEKESEEMTKRRWQPKGAILKDPHQRRKKRGVPNKVMTVRVSIPQGKR
jgi:hypothetical protein